MPRRRLWGPRLVGWLMLAGCAAFGLMGCSQGEGPAPAAKPAAQTIAPAPEPAFKPGVSEAKKLAALDPQAEAARLAKIMERKRAKPKKSFDKPKEAQIFFAEKRAPVGQTAIPVQRYVEAMQAMQVMPVFSTQSNKLTSAASAKTNALFGQALGRWTGVGPGNVGGRVRSLLIDPTTPATMYLGGVAGGVWKSVDAGTTWTPLTDLLSNLAVCSMAMDPKNSSVIYAGTGEGYYNVDAVRGAGIFKTTDAGASWSQLASTANADFYYVNKIVVSPNDSNLVYAATRKGISVSTDAGVSFTQKVDAAAINGCTDMVVRTDVTSADVVVASCGTYLGAGSSAILYRTTDNGQNWSNVLSVANMDRTSLAVAKSDQRVMYALASTNAKTKWENGLLAVYKSVDGGATWVAAYTNDGADVLANMLLTNVCSAFCAQCEGKLTSLANQGWYDNVIAVDPANANIVWVGGIDLFRSDNGGASWGLASVWWANTNKTAYNHADHHVLVFHPGYNGDTNKVLFSGNDGGLYRTDNARAAVTTETCSDSTSQVAWVSLNNGLGITQYYYGAVYPGGGTFFGGAQDNGTTRGTIAGGANAWTSLMGGDGGAVAVNPQNTNILYAEYTNLSLQKSTDGGVNFSAATTGITDDPLIFPFITPFLMDPNNPSTLWLGGRKVWRTTDGAANWTQASNDLVGSGTVSALAVAPGNADIVAVGASNGYVYVTTNAQQTGSLPTWTSSTPVAGQVSGLAFDPGDSNILYMTCSNFGQAHVRKSTDRGATWTTITGSGETALPDVPTFAPVVDPNNRRRLYVGTDLGVFASLDGGASWAVENTGFANVITEAMMVESRSNRLYAFTHGRGVWHVALPARAAAGPAADLLLLQN
ncbi:MAG: BNR/Asp-box repeat protein [Solidesulfovibrio magneticus str. Maddingley MBC34]|uniref:BNR/Asp-box repeat protein n=1 Tax=Solidesulfovibrio magneticus str. Maddingley MBC34 TaxID=1206767 RepID=K6GTC6_9BACT|nr:MAG: BNR/Asp-box repeat protein [Solidesulfovibrio magneticus str. Maddingley MBC34]